MKAMELSKAGPVLIIDTPGIDDTGELGEKRVERTGRILAKTDVAVLVTECGREPVQAAKELIRLISERKIPYLTVRNKADLYDEPEDKEPGEIIVSARTGQNIERLKAALTELACKKNESSKIEEGKVGFYSNNLINQYNELVNKLK